MSGLSDLADQMDFAIGTGAASRLGDAIGEGMRGQSGEKPISRRDLFAAAALMGILAQGRSHSVRTDTVREAEEYADLMLARLP